MYLSLDGDLHVKPKQCDLCTVLLCPVCCMTYKNVTLASNKNNFAFLFCVVAVRHPNTCPWQLVCGISSVTVPKLPNDRGGQLHCCSHRFGASQHRCVLEYPIPVSWRQSPWCVWEQFKDVTLLHAGGSTASYCTKRS